MKRDDEELAPINAMEEIEEIARGLKPAEASRLRALFYIDNRQQAKVSRPEILTQQQMVEKIVPLFRALGRAGCQLAWRRAWPNSKTKIDDAPRLEVIDIDLTGLKMPVSLPHFNRLFPEAKQAGRPKGYPWKGSIDERRAWLHARAIEIYRSRKQKELERGSAQGPTGTVQSHG